MRSQRTALVSTFARRKHFDQDVIRFVWKYTCLARASTPGVFRVIPPTAQQFYFPEVYGRGAGSLFEVKP